MTAIENAASRDRLFEVSVPCVAIDSVFGVHIYSARRLSRVWRRGRKILFLSLYINQSFVTNESAVTWLLACISFVIGLVFRNKFNFFQRLNYIIVD